MFEWLYHQLSTNQFFSGTALTGALIAIGAIFKQRVIAAWRWVLSYYRVSVEIHSEDPSFLVWLDWLKKQKFDRFRRSYRLRTRLDMTPDYGNYCVWYGWRPVWISMRRDDKQQSHYKAVPMEFITISTYSAKRQSTWFTDVLSELEKALVKSRQRSVGVYKCVSDEMDYIGSIKRHTASSVILPEGQIEAIEADIQKFYESEDEYALKGIPWRRGYLLYGIPGTGKTSLIRHLAKKFATSIYTCDHHVPFVNSEDSKNPFFVFEDIDCQMQAIREPDKTTHSNASDREYDIDSDTFGPPRGIKPPKNPMSSIHRRNLGEILNGLDGLVSMNGAIIFMTTNHIDQLDPALIRPGRVDYRIEFTYATQSQIQTLAERFFPDIGALDLGRAITVSEAQAILQRCASAQEAKAAIEDEAVAVAS